MCVSYAWIVVKSYFFVISDNFIIIFSKLMLSYLLSALQLYLVYDSW